MGVFSTEANRIP